MEPHFRIWCWHHAGVISRHQTWRWRHAGVIWRYQILCGCQKFGLNLDFVCLTGSGFVPSHRTLVEAVTFIALGSKLYWRVDVPWIPQEHRFNRNITSIFYYVKRGAWELSKRNIFFFYQSCRSNDALINFRAEKNSLALLAKLPMLVITRQRNYFFNHCTSLGPLLMIIDKC